MKTKLIQVWHIEYCHRISGEIGVMLCLSYDEAEQHTLSPLAQWYRFVAITGPHQRRIPA